MDTEPIWMCAAMVVGALLIVLATDDALAFLPIIGCVLMMGWMMWMMGGRGGHGGRRGHESK